jgi:hypothetical protein
MTKQVTWLGLANGSCRPMGGWVTDAVMRATRIIFLNDSTVCAIANPLNWEWVENTHIGPRKQKNEKNSYSIDCHRIFNLVTKICSG